MEKKDNKEYVAYYRVSTKQQGKSGLGLEAQKVIVWNKVGKPKFEFVEVESGKIDNRSELNKALELCKKNNYILIIAKLDRLSRNISFIMNLRESGIEFVCADMPELNTLTLGIFATMAQYERELISERIKNALRAKKKQGFKLGSPKNNITDETRKKSAVIRHKYAIENDNQKKAWEIIKDLQSQGFGLYKIMKKLRQYGLKTKKGKQFEIPTIKHLISLYSK